ncbi:MAG TPA: T9SS type A sorting domain-containing protein, partial [Puia sp.]|nr:T9SS type A sorting domain-containing protein [Puia sp.]
YWNVYTGTPLTSPVNVRFFFNPADTLAARNAAKAFKTSSGAALMSNLEWFKTVGNAFTPDSLTATPKANVKGATIMLAPVYGTKDGVNYAEFDGVTSFSGGTGIYIVSNTMVVLPVGLASFTGRQVNTTVLLNWTTPPGAGNLRFEIGRSADGLDWETIGQVSAAGNSANLASYSFTDMHPIGYPRDNYYRLALVDKDGRYSYSGVVLVRMSGDGAAVPQLDRIVPNPFGSDMEIDCTLPAGGPVEVQLRDMAGVILMRREYTANKGENVFRLTGLNGLAQGMYIVRVVQGGLATIGKTIKR